MVVHQKNTARQNFRVEKLRIFNENRSFIK